MGHDAGDELSPRAIAERIRALIAGMNVHDVGTAARELNVGEFALRRTISASAPRPDPDVLAAVVWEFGVDPHWLMTGTYDATIHRKAAEAGSRFAIAGRFRAMLARAASVGDSDAQALEL